MGPSPLFDELRGGLYNEIIERKPGSAGIRKDNPCQSSLEVARANLPEVIDKADTAEEVVITRNGRLLAMPSIRRKTSTHFWAWTREIIMVSEDDEHLKDFAEYMP